MEAPLIGRRMGLLGRATANSLYIGASASVNPELHRLFGPIRHAGVFEDLVLGFRAALLGRMSYIAEPLVDYTVDQGLSARIDSTRGNRRQGLAARAAALETMVIVLQQRLEHLDMVADRLDQPTVLALRERITQEAQAIRIRLVFYRSDRSLLDEAGKAMNMRAVRVLLSEAVFLVRN